MKVFYWVDYTSHYDSNTGVQRVTRGLASAWEQVAAQELVYVCWDAAAAKLIPAPPDRREKLAHFEGPAAHVGVVDEVRPTAGDWLLIPEVTHITPQPAPPTAAAIAWAKAHGLRVAAIFYDAIPLKLEEYAGGRALHAAYMGDLLEADLLIPISRLAGADFVQLAPSLPGWKQKLPLIRPVLLAGEIPSAPRQALGAFPQSEILILSIGSLEPRKNQVRLMEAFDRVTARNPGLNARLIFIGHLHPHIAPQLANYIAKNPRIEHRGYVKDQQLAALYHAAHFTSFPSLEEGFGLPILESLWHGRISLCHHLGSMAEIAADGGCLAVDCTQVEAIAAALELLIFDRATHRRLQDEALRRPIKTWRDYAGEIRALIAEQDANLRRLHVVVCTEHTRQYGANSGIQRVTRGLARGLQQTVGSVSLMKWNRELGAAEILNADELNHLAQWNGPEPRTAPLPAAGHGQGWFVQPEVYYYPGCPDFEQVLRWAEQQGLQTAVIFHDALPWKLRQFYPPEASRAHREYMLHLRRFSRILPNSHYSAAELRNFYRREGVLTPELDAKILPCPLPGEFLGTVRTTEAAALPESPIRIISVGTIEPRKNHLALLEAFHLVCARRPELDLRLTLIGGAPYPDLASSVEAHLLRNPRIEWIRQASDQVVADAYRASAFSVYPSLDEGFGLPILESVWRGVPCICRNQSSMLEIARDGGCVMVDTADATQIADAIELLATHPSARAELQRECLRRPLPSWTDYASSVLGALRRKVSGDAERTPRLSVCISTYNRSHRLALSLARVVAEAATHGDAVEVLVVDNTSTDDTQTVAEAFAQKFPIRYVRNPENVGMLGNLGVTATLARGDFVWIIGDDDLVVDRGIDRVMDAIRRQPEAELIYLNYSYHNEEMKPDWDFAEKLLRRTTCIAPGLEDRYHVRVRDIAPLTENCFTAIYSCVFRRDHAISAYTQDTSGAPFSTLPTCVPTSAYVCQQMFDRPAVFIAEPIIAVSMHCSWLRWACLFILERFPELFELMERNGADAKAIDALRYRALHNTLHHLRIVYDQEEAVRRHFSMDRFIARHRRLPFYESHWQDIFTLYENAWTAGKVLGDSLTPADLRSRHQL
jgi:glycosyltransferase involved in cell wall biosynthesis